jgi:hypothetical protein
MRHPARLIKQLFSDAEVAQLLEIRWWDWDIEKITRNIDKIMENDILALCGVDCIGSRDREKRSDAEKIINN